MTFNSLESDNRLSETLLAPLPVSSNNDLKVTEVPTEGDPALVKDQANIASSFVNLANTIIGSGILGLPYAFANTGWVMGTVLMILGALMSGLGLNYLSACALEFNGTSSFYKVADKAMPKFSLLIDVAVAVKCFGVATSYLIVIADLIPEVMEFIGAPDFWRHRKIWVVFGFCLVAPLSFLKSLDALKFTSMLSVVFVVFLTFLVFLYSLGIPQLDPCEDVDDEVTCVGNKDNIVMNMETWRVMSIFIFGFTCHQNIFSIVNELKDRSQNRVNFVVVLSIAVAFILYMIVATCGYAAFGSEVDSDILLSYPSNSLISVARVFIALLVAFSYPLQANPARKCITTLLNNIRSSAISAREQYIQFYLITTIFLGLSFAVAITVSDLGVILSLVGATGSTIVSYILPGFCYYLTFKDRIDNIRNPKWKLYGALFQGVIGIIIIPICLTFIFI